MSNQVPRPAASFTALTVTHDGQAWPLWVSDDSEPFIKDTDWAKFLGFKQPRMIRKLIKRLTDDGRLGMVVCSTASQTPGSVGGRPATEFYLTEGQALKVAARSETPAADKLLDQLIAVFMKVRRGELQPVAAAAPPTVLGALRMTVAALDEITTRQDAMDARLAEIDARTQPKPRRIAAPPAPPASRAQLVMQHFVAMVPDVSITRLADATGFTRGQVGLTLEYLKARGQIAQTGTRHAPKWEILAAKPPLTLLPNPPAPPINPNLPPAEPPPEKTTREQLVEHIQTYCHRTGRISYRDAWSQLYSRLALEDKECRGRKSHGRQVDKIDYLDAHGWTPRALDLARGMFPMPLLTAARGSQLPTGHC